MMVTPRWLEWAREIQGLAQTSTFYAENDYQLKRYQRLQEIAAEIISEHSNLRYDPLLEVLSLPQGYCTPRVDVRGAVFKQGKLLLVRERADGGWTLPGGWADVGDIPSESVEREVWEEAGFRVKAQKVVGIYDTNRFGTLELFHAYKIVFLCRLVGGDARPSDETSEVAFFSDHEIPKELSSERTKMRHIQDVFTCLNDPTIQTVFD